VSVSAAFFSPSHASRCSLSSARPPSPTGTPEAVRIEQDRFTPRCPQDEVEQRGARLRLDVALQGSDGGLATLDQVGDDGRIGFDVVWWGTPAARRQSAAHLDGVGERRDEVAALEDDLQRPPDERIGSPQLQEAGATRRPTPRSGATSTHNLPPARTSAGGSSAAEREAQGFHGVGHHLLVTDGDVDVVLSVAGCGNGEKRGDRPALDDLEFIIDQAPFDVLGTAEVRFDPSSNCASRTTCASVSAGCCCSSGSIACSWVRQPAGREWQSAWWRPSWRQRRVRP